MDIKIEKWHPKLLGKDYKIIDTDKILEKFNCVSFSIDLYDDWSGSSEPSWRTGYDPPSEIDRSTKLENYIKYFKIFGYDICDNEEYEEGFEKIAIYVDEKNNFKHVARQFVNKWRSKLGGYKIIEHELEWLTGYDADNYGEIGSILKRKI
jgi:hypothetical protein